VTGEINFGKYWEDGVDLNQNLELMTLKINCQQLTSHFIFLSKIHLKFTYD
jgi:hypothetical protein